MKSVLVTRVTDILFYDAEYDIGLVAYDESAALANTVALNLALAACHKNGSFAFVHGTAGPVMRPIWFSAKTFYFQGTIQSAVKVGSGTLIGSGGRVYLYGEDQYNSGSLAGGQRTNLVRIDGSAGGAVIRLRGQGFTIEKLCIQGRKYSVENGSTGPTEGTATPIGIEVEGRASIATGSHVIRDCLISACTHGIACRAGYHDSGTTLTYAGIDGLYNLKKDENHGEAGVVENVTFYNCSYCFTSENVQSVIWNFKALRVGRLGSGATTVFNIIRGGDIMVDGLELLMRDVVVLSVHRDATAWPAYQTAGTWYFKDTDLACPGNNPDPHDYSPYTATFELTGLKYDGYSGNGTNYLTLFKFQGPNYVDAIDMQSMKWMVRMTGRIAHPPVPQWGGSPDYDYTRLIEINDSGNIYHVPRTSLLFDIMNLPTTNFTLLGSGPWYYPTPPT